MLLIKKRIWHVAGLLATILACSNQATAAVPTAAELDDVFVIKLLAYEQEDSNGKGGNPNLSEDATIYEGIALLKRRVSDTDLLKVQGLWDQVTAASYDDAKNKAEIVSGATGYNPGRWGVDVGWTHEMALFDLSLNAGYGQEFAYRAHNMGFGLSRTLAEGSTQFTLDFQSFNDVIRVIRWDGTQEPNDRRKTRTTNIGLVQTLTPLSALNIGWSHTEQSGFLATSFNSVLVGEDRLYESVPDTRRRDALSIRYKHALNEDVIQLGYGLYQDDWGIDSSTLELRYIYAVSEMITLEPHYRFYTQTAADFFAQTFESSDDFMTSDPDLGAFDTHSTGLLMRFFHQRVFSYDNVTYDFSLNYSQRSDDLNFYWITFGASFPL